MDSEHRLILSTDELFALGEIAAYGRRHPELQKCHQKPALAAMEKLLALMEQYALDVAQSA